MTKAAWVEVEIPHNYIYQQSIAATIRFYDALGIIITDILVSVRFSVAYLSIGVLP